MKHKRFLMRGQLLVLYQSHISRNFYHTKTGWLQYRINLVTRLPGLFPTEKILLSMIGLTLKLFSGSVLVPGMPNGAFSVLFIHFLMEIYSIMETQ